MFFFNCCRGSAQDFGPKLGMHLERFGRLSSFNGSLGSESSESEADLTDLSTCSGSDDDDVMDAAVIPQVPIMSDMVRIRVLFMIWK
jgi:hypothetical protein